MREPQPRIPWFMDFFRGPARLTIPWRVLYWRVEECYFTL